MTDQFKNIKDEEFVPKKKSISPGVQSVIDELEALSAENFKAGNLIAHYTVNTAIEIVKKHLG